MFPSLQPYRLISEASFHPKLSPSGNVLRRLKKIGGLTFYKDFSTGTINADYSVGSSTGTFTQSGGLGTYKNSSGVIVKSTSTSNVPRFTYETIATGKVKKGLLIEVGITNRATYSETSTNAAWTKTNITASSTDTGTTYPDGTTTGNSLTASAANGTFTQQYTTTAAVYNASLWIKRKTGTGPIYLRANTADAYIDITQYVGSSWIRVQTYSSNAANPTFDLKIGTDGDAVYIYGMQLEADSYAHQYVPSLTTAVTRNADKLTYPILNNLPALTSTTGCTILMNVTTFADKQSVYKLLFDTDTVSTRIALYNSNFHAFPNFTADIGSVSRSWTCYKPNSNYSIGAVFYGNTESIKTNMCANGILEYPSLASNAVTYTLPSWGTNFYVGSKNTGFSQADCIVHAFAIFNRALTQAEIAKALNALNFTYPTWEDTRPKLMPLGDSITRGFQGSSTGYGYRKLLQDTLGNYTYNVVGYGLDPIAYDPRYSQSHSAIGGETSAQILERLPVHLNNLWQKPNSAGSIILIHAGSNDIFQSISNTTTVANIMSMIDMIDAFDPTISIYVSTVIPNNGSDALVTALNTKLVTALIAKQVTKSNLHRIDMNAAFKAIGAGWNAAYLSDGTHPNDTGYDLMATTFSSGILNNNAQYCDGH